VGHCKTSRVARTEPSLVGKRGGRGDYPSLQGVPSHASKMEKPRRRNCLLEETKRKQDHIKKKKTLTTEKMGPLLFDQGLP